MGATTHESKMESKIKKNQIMPVRYFQILLIFLGTALSFSAKIMMSIAIVAMTDPDVDNTFSWSIQQQSVILSSFTWGYIVLQCVTGELASRIGGMTFMAICMGVNSVVSLLLPVLAENGGWMTVCACRLVQGVTQGAILPAMYHLVGQWVPIEERTRVINFIFGGGALGTASQLIVSGYIADYWGWAAIFYINGVVGGTWTIVYLFLGSNSPQDSKTISADEKAYIQESLEHVEKHKTMKTPWKTFLTSLPFISVVVANIGYSWGYWTMLTELPTYMNYILGVNIKSNGIMSALPYISTFIFNFPIGFASDYAIKKKWISLTVCRKISNSVGFFGPAICLLSLTYISPGNLTAAILLLVTALGLSAGIYSGFNIVHLDIAPNFASTMMGVANFIANLIAIFAPLVVGLILKDETNPSEWYVVFYVSAAMLTFTNIFFVIFGTSKRQKWNEQSEDK